jgi:hypothetical protein
MRGKIFSAICSLVLAPLVAAAEERHSTPSCRPQSECPQQARLYCAHEITSMPVVVGSSAQRSSDYDACVAHFVSACNQKICK